jgi:hypothetical protein
MEDSFIGYNNLCWQFFSFRIWGISFYALLAFRVLCWEICYFDRFVFICDLVLLVAFYVLSLFYILDVLTIISCVEFLFWSCLFSVLKASWTWITIYFPRFWIFPLSFYWIFFHIFILYFFFLLPIICRFSLLMMP